MNYTHFKGYFFNWIKNQYMLLLHHLFLRVNTDPENHDVVIQIPLKKFNIIKKEYFMGIK